MSRLKTVTDQTTYREVIKKEVAMFQKSVAKLGNVLKKPKPKPGDGSKKYGVVDFVVIGTIVGIGILVNIPAAHAITAPAQGSFAYSVYDIGVNDILDGPIGFVGGVGAVVFGAINAIQGKVMGAIPAILGGAAMLQANNIVTSLGAII